MGSCCFSGTASASASVEVAVPRDVLWKVITDVESYPSVVESIVSIQRIESAEDEADKSLALFEKEENKKEKKQMGPLKQGSQWIEIRNHEGNSVELHKTVTVMNTHSFRLSMKLPGNYKDAYHTSTLACHAVTDESCLLVGTFALVFTTFIDRVKLALIARKAMAMAREDFQRELQQYGNAALDICRKRKR